MKKTNRSDIIYYKRSYVHNTVDYSTLHAVFFTATTLWVLLQPLLPSGADWNVVQLRKRAPLYHSNTSTKGAINV